MHKDGLVKSTTPPLPYIRARLLIVTYLVDVVEEGEYLGRLRREGQPLDDHRRRTRRHVVGALRRDGRARVPVEDRLVAVGRRPRLEVVRRQRRRHHRRRRSRRRLRRRQHAGRVLRKLRQLLQLRQLRQLRQRVHAERRHDARTARGAGEQRAACNRRAKHVSGVSPVRCLVFLSASLQLPIFVQRYQKYCSESF